MDEENNLMEEKEVMEDSSSSSSDDEFACGDPQVEPRVGDEFQVEIPPMMSASKRAAFLSTPLALDDSSYSFLVGKPVRVMWIDKHRKEQGNGDDDNVDMNQSLKSLRSKRSRCSAKTRGKSEEKKQRLNLEPVPVIPSSSWDDFEVASFVLGLYTFGKNFTQVKKFMESKKIGEIVLFYYGKFYNSAKFHSWSDSRKKRNRKCVYGRKLYSGWRQQQLLSRLILSITDESKRQMLVNVSKSFAEGSITLEKYISTVKDLVGLKLLVDAVAIGKEKEDLTVVTSVPMRTKPWFTVSPKHSSVPGLGNYTSLTSVDIINKLTGSSRLSKARCNDIFWEAVWPRLLARGWRSEQPKDRSYFTSKDNIVFIVPGVKKFSRGKLVKGEDYFDSVSDILTKVASEPELLEFETGGEIREAAVNKENSSDQSDEESSQSDSRKHRYLKSPCSNRGPLQMKFTVVDSSLAGGGKLCDLRNLNVESLASELKTCFVDEDSSVPNVEKSQMIPLDTKNQVDDPMRFTIIDTSREKPSGFRRSRHLPGNVGADSSVKEEEEEEEEETLEKVKDPSKRLSKHRSTRRAETNYHSVNSASSLKRRRLSACMREEKSCSRETPVFTHLPGDDTEKTVCPESDHLSLCAVQHQNGTREEVNEEKERDETVLSADYVNLKSDESKMAETGQSEIQEALVIEPNGLNSISVVDNNCLLEEIRTGHELISSEHEAVDSDEKRASNDLKQEQEVELPSISGSNSNSAPPSNDVGITQELGSSEQQNEQEINTDGPRRQSTRKRPLTTRALEALESGFLTAKRMKSTTKPRKRESSTRKKHSAKPCNGAQVLPDNGSAYLDQRGEDKSIFAKKEARATKPLDQVEDSNPSFLLNEATTENKALEPVQESKPVPTEYPKLPPIVLKLSFKRNRGVSET